MAVNINRLRSAWEKSVGRASGISFDIASLLTDDPDELMLILSSSDEGMMVLDRIKKQYEKAQKLVKFANKFKEIKPGAGALFGDKLLAATNPHWNRFNAHGTTEHFTKPIAIPKARYEGFKAPIFTPNRFPIVTSEDAQIFREEDEASRIRQQDAMRRAEKSFHSTRDNRNWDDYLTGRTGDWSGYNPNDGPLAQIFREEEYKKERDKNTRLAESRGSIRNRKERLAMMKEFPTFFKNSKMSTKDMREIARTLRTIRRTPILKNMVFNPFASAAAFVGLQKAAFNISDAANKEVTDWQNQALMTGGLSKELEGAGYLAGLKGPGEMMEVLGKFQAKYGPAATDVLKGFGSTIAAAPAEQRMIVASRLGLDTKTSALAMALSNPEMFQSDQRITQAARNKLEAVKTMGYSSGSSFSDTVGSLWLSMFAGAQARDARDFEYVNKDVNENYSEMMNRLVYVLDDVKKTAEADDQFAAGKFETYTDTTDNSKKEVNVQMNLGGVTVQPGGDARGFVDELMAISTNGISQSRAVVDAFDTKRKK